MPSLNPWKRNKPTITAAAGNTGTGRSPVSPEVIGKRMEKWQERVLNLISSIPEPAGASALIHNTLEKVVLKVEAEGVEQQHIEEIEELLKSFDLGRAGMLIWQVGEAYPMWERTEDGGIHWEIHSPAEIKIETNKPPQHINSEGKWKDIPAGAQYFRNWKQDPAHRHKAWSPHKGVLDLLESMYLHQLADTAVATSRLAGAGILYWPTDMPSIDTKGGPPEEGSREKLQEELQKAMMQSISDRNSSDAVVPLIVFGDPTLGDNHKPEHILLERPDDAKAFANRMEAYSERYARGIELPIESVQGMGPANHWTAWVIKEDKWRFYISPIADIPAKGLTKNFLKPILQVLDYDANIVSKARIVPDGSALIEKPDKSDAAIRLKQLEVISDEAALRETGFDPKEDKASPEEKARLDSGNVRLQELPANFRDTSPSG